MDEEAIREALEAETTEQIECPVCGDEIPAFELATDHAHNRELLGLILELAGEVPDDRMPSLAAQHATNSESTTDDYYAEDTSGLRETIIRFDPKGSTPSSMPERLCALEDGLRIDEIDTLPERRVFSVGNEEDYEQISEAAWGVANAFVDSSIHAGHELVACPECGYEGSVDRAVFPGGTDHYSDAENKKE